MSIAEYPIKPVAFKGRYYKRRSNANHLMSVSEVVNMHLSAFNTSWDFYLNPHFNIENLSLEKVQLAIDMMNRRGRTIDDDPMSFLYKNDLVRNDKISNAAFLLFTAVDSVFTTIEMGRFQTDILIKDSVRSKSDVINQFEEVIDFVKKHINKEIVIKGASQNIERWQYPLEAVREVVANMIVHRDYSLSSDSIVKVYDNKIEFYNPGGLPETISIEDLLSFNQKSVPRNKLIADFFKDLGIIEKYGSGIKRIVTFCHDYGLPNPKFENSPEGFMVTLYAVSDKVPNKVPDKVPDDLTVNQYKIIELLRENNRLSLMNLAELIGISKRKMLDNINTLKGKGRIERVGNPKSGYWKVIDKKL